MAAVDSLGSLTESMQEVPAFAGTTDLGRAGREEVGWAMTTKFTDEEVG
ncbi:hypothetical protein R9C00_15985 [Flammeovirgaceae bacterium SG7u.111]|nr:hypothetical protein [Flammeovirgaceae bacterium SG7u.132]WPO33202.1 hypothetical protein R9C00_15985 [Flammeovirgaceae bacterium SG7u.111]